MKNNELRKIRIKNRTCYYFDDTTKFEDFNCDNILLDEKSDEDILIYDVSYKTLTGATSLRILFDNVDSFIRVYDETKY